VGNRTHNHQCSTYQTSSDPSHSSPVEPLGLFSAWSILKTSPAIDLRCGGSSLPANTHADPASLGPFLARFLLEKTQSTQTPNKKTSGKEISDDLFRLNPTVASWTTLGWPVSLPASARPP